MEEEREGGMEVVGGIKRERGRERGGRREGKRYIVGRGLERGRDRGREGGAKTLQAEVNFEPCCLTWAWVWSVRLECGTGHTATPRQSEQNGDGMAHHR